LIMSGNSYKGELGPGKYTFESFIGKIFRLGAPKNVSAIIVRDGDFPLAINVNGLPSKEFLEISVSCNITVNVSDIKKFLLSLIGTKLIFTVTELKHILFPLLTQGLREMIKNYSIEELSKDLNIRKKIDTHLKQIFSEILERYGIGFRQLQTIEFKHEAYDEFNRSRGTCWLQTEESKLKLENRKTLSEIYSADELQSLKELERKNELDILKQNLDVDKEEDEHAIKIRKIELQAKIREILNTDKFNEISNAEELSKFLHNIDKDKLIRQEEKEILIEEFRNRKEDKNDARKHLLLKLSMQREEEIRMLRAEIDQKVNLSRFDLKIQLAHIVENEENRRQIAALEQQKKKFEFEYQKQYKDLQEKVKLRQIERDEELKDTDIKIKKRSIEHEADVKEAEDGIGLLRKMKQLKREVKEAKQKIELDKKIAEQKLEIEKMQAMDKMTAETLISMSKPDQAKIILELQKTKVMQGMNTEQILALAAEKNHVIAEAFKEKFANQNAVELSNRERELYDKMLKIQQDSAIALQQTTEKVMSQIGEIAKESLR
jgi:hypothetical protein